MANSVVYVNPALQVNGSGSLAQPFNSWSQIIFNAGTTYLQMAGTTAKGNLSIGTSASAASPIVISSYGSGAAPTIAGTIVFDHASNVSLSGFTVTAGQAAGVVIQNGANNIQVLSNTISGSVIGIWLGNGAQGNNTISGNSISNNTLFGIGVDGVANAAGHETQIVNNDISYNGSHGIELRGNDFIVAGNTLFNNGQTRAGSSGIHAYATGPNDSYGADNTISGNMVVGTAKVNSVDGNGIELDQWTHDNSVTANSVMGNDGSGIVVYNSWHNSIDHNMVFCNDAAPAEPGSGGGEIVLASTGNLNHDNTVSENLFLGISSYAPVVSVDAESIATNNGFSNNIFESFGAFAMYDWGGTLGDNATLWRSATGSSDWFGGVPASSTGSPGIGASSYDYIFSGSPFSPTFRYPWQTAGSYRIG